MKPWFSPLASFSCFASREKSRPFFRLSRYPSGAARSFGVFPHIKELPFLSCLNLAGGMGGCPPTSNLMGVWGKTFPHSLGVLGGSPLGEGGVPKLKIEGRGKAFPLLKAS